MDLGLGDKVVLVTGSYRGTGEGTAHVLARVVERVYVCQRRRARSIDNVTRRENTR